MIRDLEIHIKICSIILGSITLYGPRMIYIKEVIYMTGRDLIIYILKNNLEDEPVFKDGKFIGFLTDVEAARKMNVGTATIHALIKEHRLEGVTIDNSVLVPDEFE